jgi:hypothetical protein
MGAFFSSLGRTITAGVVLLIIIVLAVGGLTEGGMRGGDLFIVRWLHVMAGVMWIGLLWYFNFVQTPSMPKIPDEQKPAIGKVIAPAALFWFRWSALATVVLGLLLADADQGRARHRHRHVAGPHHGVQRLDDHLAEPEKSARYRDGISGREGRCGQTRWHDVTHQHDALDRDAVLHGRAVARRDVELRRGPLAPALTKKRAETPRAFLLRRRRDAFIEPQALL